MSIITQADKDYEAEVVRLLKPYALFKFKRGDAARVRSMREKGIAAKYAAGLLFIRP